MAAEGSMAEVDEVLMIIARHINGLSEKNRNTRKRALEGIRKEVVLRKPALEPDSLQKVFSQIWTPVLTVLSDPVEKCRELSLGILKFFVNNVAQPEDSLPYAIPVLVRRLCKANEAESEPAEEVRLEFIYLVADYVKLCKKQMAPYVDDIIKIFQATVLDPYPEVRKESCKCLCRLAETVPQQFHMQSESMIQPLLKTIAHQHSRVRVEVVLAIGSTIQHGNNKSVDDVVSHLAQRLFDQSPIVRAAVTQVVGNWLLDLLDRYSYFPKLIPLLLTSTQDEMPDIVEQAEGLWNDVGLKYEMENENDLKDKMDFTKPDPEHYPKGIERPNLGCRTLMYHHFSRILGGINNDISDWVVGTRIKSAQLLFTMLLNMEENATMHLEKVVHALSKGSTDEEAKVIQYVDKCSSLIGYFVPPEIWVKMVLKQVKLCQSSQAHSSGMLRILSGVISGSQRLQLKAYLPDICSVIGDDEICHSSDLKVQTQLCSCVHGLIGVAQSDCETVSRELFTIIICIRAVTRSENIMESSKVLLKMLADAQELDRMEDLFSRHSQQVIDGLQDSYASWTQHSTERLVFDTLLMESGPVVGELLDSIIPVLQANLQPEKDVETKAKFFNLLSKLMERAETTLNSEKRFGEFCVCVVQDMILPNCVWRAGRTASSLRMVAVSCLWALLKNGLMEQHQLLQVAEALITQLTSTVEDDNNGTRLVSMRVLNHLFTQAGRVMDHNKLHQFYPVLLKRLDDGNDSIRIATCKTFTAYMLSFERDYQVDLYRAHYEAIYNGLMVHLDDPDRSIQEEVLELLKSVSVIAPSMLLKEVDSVKHKHRSTHYCDLLVSHIHSLPKPE